jgi:enoyl-CoA hydratase
VTVDVEDLVQYEKDGHVATIAFNRPEKLNAVTVPMGYRVHALIKEINHDDDVRAVLVTGRGERAFTVGTDISGLDQYGSNWQMRNRQSDYALDFWELRKPAVAAIRGWCIGGGLEIAAFCDLRIASPSARFAAGEIQLGWHGGSGQTQMLPRLVGFGNALQMLLTGDPVDAEEAHRTGLVQELVPEERVLERATELAHRIAGWSPVATQLTKHAARMALSTPPAIGLAYENDLFTYCMTTNDAREGIAAFVEKRDPVFRGD